MVHEKTSLVGKYLPDGEMKDSVLEFLSKAESLEAGKYPLAGGAFCNLLDSAPKPLGEVEVEGHEEYVDLQCVLIGKEGVILADKGNGETLTRVKEGKDCSLYAPKAYSDVKTLDSGEFMLLFPADLHQCGIEIGADRVKKAVVKIPLSAFDKE